MKVAIYVDRAEDARAAVIARQASRAAMPDVEVWQLTTAEGPAIDGFDRVHRVDVHGEFGVRRCMAHADVEGDTLFVDSDVTILTDVRHVFDGARWDWAVTTRHDPINPAKWLPYNSGVTFCRRPALYYQLADWLEEMPFTRPGEGILLELTFCNFVRARHENVAVLAGEAYNYLPREPREDLQSRAIVHWKGVRRKEWMLQRFAAVTA